VRNEEFNENMKQIPFTSCTIVFIFALLISISGIKAQSDNLQKESEVEAWFNQGEWLNGLKLKPHSATDKIEFNKQYLANKNGWDKAIAFMKDHNLDRLKTGKYVIEGENVFADITDNPSSELKDAKWHSHRQYCDIIYVIKGKEKIGIAPIQGAPVIIPFTGKGDSQFYNQEMKGTYYVSNLDTFFILLPSDVHRPFIQVKGCTYEKRIRIKIKSL